MEKKICRKCGVLKALSEFYLRKNGPRAGKYYEKCKLCFKERGRDYYHLNRERQLVLVKARTQKYLDQRRQLLAELKNKACKDCGKFYPPWVMDFDHKDGETKLGNIAHMFLKGMWRTEKVLAEIKKCDLVCSNCHRMRTYGRTSRNYDKILQSMEVGGYSFHWNKK